MISCDCVPVTATFAVRSKGPTLRRFSQWLIAIVVLHLLVAGGLAWQRPIDGDEGYYGLAARLVAEGRTPYADFFYPQAPLLPYVYAPAAALVGAPQLPDLRLPSVLFSVLTVGLAAVLLHRLRGASGAAAAVGLLLLALSPEFLTWNTTIKTYAWVNLMVMAGLVAWQRGATGENRRLVWLAGGGVCLGLAVSARLLYAPAAVVPAVWLLLARRRNWGGAIAWSGGLAVGLLPVWIALARDPEVFWFNNLVYHQLRFSELEDASVLVRAAAAGKELGLAVVTGPGLLLMVVLAGLGLRRGVRPTAPAMPAAVSLSLWMAAVLTVTCLLPDPTHSQYFTGGLPTLLVAPATWALVSWPGARARTALAVSTVAALVVAALGLGLIRRDLPPDQCWQLDHYRKICHRIEALSDPNDVVFSFWSGYVAGSGRRAQPGLENHFAVGVSERLDARRRSRYHIGGRREIAEAFRLESPRVVVVGVWMNEVYAALEEEQIKDLIEHFDRHYQGVEDLGGVKLSLRKREIQRR